MLQLPPIARFEPQLSVSLKLALAAMFVMLRVAVPLLLRVTDCAGLTEPTSSLSNIRIVGDGVAFGPINPGCNRTETVVPVTAMSTLPSPLKSPTASDTGLAPAAYSIPDPNVPLPLPKRTTALKELATARSNLPSPLKSPRATESVAIPVAYARKGGNVPSPLPKKMFTPWSFATAKSSFPSPLKSPTATELGFGPAG